MLEARNIEKSYPNLHVLKGINLSIKKGEIVSIVGASGAGKSTLLQILGTLDRSDSGAIELNHVRIETLSDRALSEFRNKNIGFIFQFHNLLPEFTAFENVCLPGYIGDKDDAHVEKRAMDLLQMLGLGDRVNHKPSELSGGEQQRVAIARALINEPTIILRMSPAETWILIMRKSCISFSLNYVRSLTRPL
jgi:lipoprotein-releasing system ATP-binding protein